MNKNFYPLLEDFLKDLRLGKLNEEATKEQIASLPKLGESENALSPYTGKTVNVKKIAEEIEKAKYKIVTQSQLYRPYIHEMSPTIFTWVVPTMATDGVRLFVNPEFAAGLTGLGKIFVLIHEIMHCMLMHDKRVGGREHELFNIAADMEINTIIVDTSDDFDEKFVKDTIHGLYDKKYLNMPVEDIYEDMVKNGLPKMPPAQPGTGQMGKMGQGPGGQPGQPGQPGDPGEGEGEGEGSGPTHTIEEQIAAQQDLHKKLKDIDKGGAGAVIDKKTGEQIAAAEGYSDDEAKKGDDNGAKWKEHARSIMADLEKAKNAGSGYGGALIGKLGKMLKPNIDWKTRLKIYVGNALSREGEWRIGAKKHLHKSDEYLKRGLKPKSDALRKVVVCVDVSGSIFSGGGGTATFERIISEINGIIFTKRIKEVTVIFFDSRVDKGSVQKIKPKGNAAWIPKKIDGGGGTNFQAPLNWIKENYNDKINLCIFLTDGEASDPTKPSYANKFIWVVYDNFGWNAPFGKVIKTSAEDM